MYDYLCDTLFGIPMRPVSADAWRGVVLCWIFKYMILQSKHILVYIVDLDDLSAKWLYPKKYCLQQL